MSPGRPASLKEEGTINLYFWHAHCSATRTTTCTVGPRGAAQTHLSNTKMPPPHPLYPNPNISIWLCNSNHNLTQSGTHKCKALVQRASPFACVCVLLYRSRHLVYMDSQVSSTTHTDAQVKEQIMRHKHNVSFIWQPSFLGEGEALWGLNEKTKT